MQRETREFVTPSGTKVLLKTYITAREANAIKDKMFKGLKIDLTDGTTPSLDGLEGSVILEQEKLLVTTIVDSLNGEPLNGNIEKILDLRNDDYQAIVKEVNAIYAGNFQQGK